MQYTLWSSTSALLFELLFVLTIGEPLPQNFPSTDPAYIAVGGVDERGSRKPPAYQSDTLMSGTGPALDFVGPAWQILTYSSDPSYGGFYNEGYLSTEPDITPAEYPNMLQLPEVVYAAGDVARVRTVKLGLWRGAISPSEKSEAHGIPVATAAFAI